MKAHEQHFGFMQNETIQIPFFQRAYVWQKEQWERLFEDLETSFENKTSHFLGSIILKDDSANGGGGSQKPY
ncbi:DUF262 domain-containing protein [Helicobacter sp. 11S02596-1]|uniref:DUF262 domain-containing protein n=1 Tax=Helicobacter sp. 11S02596-1 TaxID=1476194 RepID=UPI000BA56E2B|nr:DUF262 domain-containing protein [Helicobacter sp. 11S02596-1]PAF43190.1 hypothetical protein BJI48_05450 [Helicobacter sp. 11S02596-1]